MNFIMLLFGKKIGIPIENYMRSKTKRIFFFNQNDGWKKMMEKIDEKKLNILKIDKYNTFPWLLVAHL